MRLTQLNRNIPDENSCDERLVDRILFEGFDYNGETADLIMVLGSKKAYIHRVPVAAELLRNEKAPAVLFTGGKSQESDYGFMPEYRSMLLTAEKCGMDTGKIICETKSLNTIENFEFSDTIICQKLPRCRKIILVTASYHMRRSIMLAENILPQYEFIPCPADSGTTTRSKWMLSEKGRKTAYSELAKLQQLAENKLIENITI